MSWSKLNKGRVEKLINAGLMAPAGLVKVEAAKKDGSWNALDAVAALEIPPDLAGAFSRNKTAKEYFESFPRSVKGAILQWIISAKKPQTRANRRDGYEGGEKYSCQSVAAVMQVTITRLARVTVTFWIRAIRYNQ